MGHHIGDLTSLYSKKNMSLFLSREQDEIGDFPGLFSKKGIFPLEISAPHKKLLKTLLKFILNLKLY